MSALKVGSLFSGIGGFELGLERAGMEVAWSCDVEPFAQHILKKHWPDNSVYPDITQLKGADVEPVDVLCGGFPCQDISLAGKGAGIEEGTRSGLWSEYARLVGELRPRWVVIENVANLRSKGLDRVLRDLSLLGYDAEWDRIRASDVGAPHQRARLWIVAYPNGNDGGQGWEGRPDPSGARERVAERTLQDLADPARDVQGGAAPGGTIGERARPSSAAGRAGQVADALGVGQREPADEAHAVAGSRDTRRVFGGGSQFAADAGRIAAAYWPVEPDVGRVAHGVPARVDRLRALGNALVPQIAQWIGERIVEYEASLRPGSQSGT